MGQGYKEAEEDEGAKETEGAEGAEGAEGSKGPRWLRGLTRLIWIWVEFGLFRAKNPYFYGRKQKFWCPRNRKKQLSTIFTLLFCRAWDQKCQFLA